MAENSKILVKSSTALTRFDPKARKKLVIRGLTALAEVRDADFYFFKGEEHRTGGELRQAIDNYEKALRMDAKHEDSLFWMGCCYLKEWVDDDLEPDEPNLERAAEAFQKLIDIREKKDNLLWYDCVMYFKLGLTQYGLGLYEKAIESFEQAIELNPEDADSYYCLGIAQAGLGLYEKAIESYTQVIELKPEEADSYYNLGNAQYRLGLDEKAIESYTQAIELNPEHAAFYYNLGNAQAHLGLYENAIESFEKYLRLDGDKTPECVEYAKRTVKQLKVSSHDGFDDK